MESRWGHKYHRHISFLWNKCNKYHINCDDTWGKETNFDYFACNFIYGVWWVTYDRVWSVTAFKPYIFIIHMWWMRCIYKRFYLLNEFTDVKQKYKIKSKHTQLNADIHNLCDGHFNFSVLDTHTFHLNPTIYFHSTENWKVYKINDLSYHFNEFESDPVKCIRCSVFSR